MTRDDWYELTAELIAADDAADPRRLAAIAWRLYGELGVEQAEIDRMHTILRSIRASGGPADGG